MDFVMLHNTDYTDDDLKRYSTYLLKVLQRMSMNYGLDIDCKIKPVDIDDEWAKYACRNVFTKNKFLHQCYMIGNECTYRNINKRSKLYIYTKKIDNKIARSHDVNIVEYNPTYNTNISTNIPLIMPDKYKKITKERAKMILCGTYKNECPYYYFMTDCYRRYYKDLCSSKSLRWTNRCEPYWWKIV